MSGNEANGSQPGAANSGDAGDASAVDAASPPQGPTVTVSGNGITFSGMDAGGPNFGRNGIQMKWPEHPGEYGLKGAEKHKQWNNDVK